MAYCKRWTGRTKNKKLPFVKDGLGEQRKRTSSIVKHIGRAKKIWEWPILRGGQGEQNKWKGPIVEGGLGEQKNNENDLFWKVDWENWTIMKMADCKRWTGRTWWLYQTCTCIGKQ